MNARIIACVISLATTALAPGAVQAQRPGPPPREGRPSGPQAGPGYGPMGPGPLMEVLDTDRDGVISAEEIAKASESLKALDRDKDGKIERSELRASFAGRGGPGRRGPGGPGRIGPGGPPEGRGPGRISPGGPPEGRGPGRGPGRLGPGGPPESRGEGPKIGTILPPFVREELKLNDDQKKQIEAVESETRAKLEKILTPEQMKDFESLLRRGPGGPPRERGPEDGGPPDRPRRPE